MGRRGGDHEARATSSIALLQERFRRLQRAKEMREERELYGGSRVHSEHTGGFFLQQDQYVVMMSSSPSPSPSPDPLPPRTQAHHQVGLSLWPNDHELGSSSSRLKRRCYKERPLVWSPARESRVANNNVVVRPHDDVDTSLHL